MCGCNVDIGTGKGWVDFAEYDDPDKLIESFLLKGHDFTQSYCLVRVVFAGKTLKTIVEAMNSLVVDGEQERSARTGTSNSLQDNC
jgi:hypothetical protein